MHTLYQRIVALSIISVSMTLTSEVRAAGNAPKPTICTRSCWGARAPRSVSYMSGLTKAVVHHTAGGEFNTTSYSASKAYVRGIQNLHMDANGWSDIGYHFLVDKFGYIFEGRYASISSLPLGAHTLNNNTNTFGFNCMGYFHTPYNNVPTNAMLDSLADIIAWRMPNGWSTSATYGHRQLSASACPGDILYNKMSSIRSDIADRIANGGGDTGYVGGPSAVAWGAGRVDVVVRGGGDRIYHKYYSSGNWSSFMDRGGSSKFSPGMTTWGSGRLDIFITNNTDSKLGQRFYSSPDWSAWGTHDGTLHSSPDGVSWGVDRIDLVCRGGGDEVYHKWFDRANGGWSGWETLGGTAKGDPTICSWGPGRLDIFCRGGGDNLYHKWWSNGVWYPEGRTGDWENLGGTITSSPDAVAWGSGRIDVVARATDNSIRLKTYDSSLGGWDDGYWVNLGGTATSKPAICSWGVGRLDVFVRGGDGGLYHNYYTGGAWQRSSDWENLGGTLY